MALIGDEYALSPPAGVVRTPEYTWTWEPFAVPVSGGIPPSEKDVEYLPFWVAATRNRVVSSPYGGSTICEIPPDLVGWNSTS